MSRATPLPPDERRRALIEATLPLLREHGLATSTRQIAEAAGVAEGTIFRAFASKAELIEATISDAVSLDRLVGRLDAAASGRDLEASVTAVVGVLQEQARDTRLVFALGGHAADERDPRGCRRPSAREMSGRVTDALTRLLSPHADRLSLDAATAASMLLALGFGSSFTALTGGPAPTPAQVAGVLLHGISTGVGEPGTVPTGEV